MSSGQLNSSWLPLHFFLTTLVSENKRCHSHKIQSGLGNGVLVQSRSNLFLILIMNQFQERPYKCPHCTRAFTVKSTLLTHAKIHQSRSQRRQPPCHHCGKVFHSAASLKTHIKQHTRSLNCEDCQESFLTAGALNEHKQSVHKKFSARKKEGDETRLQEPLIITQQGFIQNAPRYRCS